MLGFDLAAACSIAIIGGADGPMYYSCNFSVKFGSISNKKLCTKKPVMLRSNSGLTELSGLTITHFLKEKLGGVEKKRKNAWSKFLCELGRAKICN